MEDYNLVLSLTSDGLNTDMRTRALENFAYEFGWVPSDELREPALREFANAHLIVDHGLESAAVITFLRDPYRFSDLGTTERKRLFALSYNNLVDWHIQVEADRATFVYNRTSEPIVVDSERISRANYESLRATAFDRIVQRRPTTNLPALDDALIKTISLWKRMLSAEMGYAVKNESLSALFNAIIFARAAEDQRRYRGYLLDNRHIHIGERALLQLWLTGEFETPSALLINALKQFIETDIPDVLMPGEELRVFDNLDRASFSALLTDFYRNKYASYYDYDFSIMSKHALSRVYENYVSILRLEESPQASLFPELPIEERDRAFGSIYTPQYVAKFFGRYLREHTSPAQFRKLRICDPACGSGIFLRTLLEMQCDPLVSQADDAQIKTLFEHVLGVDVDSNAAYATRLSLSLLHLVLTNQLPTALNIESAEAIQYFRDNPKYEEAFDTVVANPPFVAIEAQSEEMRQLIAEVLGKKAKGRVDMYIPFLQIALRLLKPGGFGCFVLPHSFLLSKSAGPLRKALVEAASIRCVADLSSVRVFGDVGTYVLLLIFQKHGAGVSPHAPATVVRCQDFPGQALQDAAEDRIVDTDFYSVYKVEQTAFREKEWILLPSNSNRLHRRLRDLPQLSKFLMLRQGVVTGADWAFIRSADSVPNEERGIYVPLLRDREMIPYATPEKTESLVFYPFRDGERMEEEELASEYPETWAHLNSFRDRLDGQKYRTRYRKKWWEPLWPRSPDELFRSKLVSPHLVLVPRFSWDQTGVFAVSRSPFLYPRETGTENDLLRYFLAILNSSVAFWHLSSHSHVYRGGYLMLESKTLASLPVPDPTSIDPSEMKVLLQLVDSRMVEKTDRAIHLEREIDLLVTSMYGIAAEDRRELGITE